MKERPLTHWELTVLCGATMNRTEDTRIIQPYGIYPKYLNTQRINTNYFLLVHFWCICSSDYKINKFIAYMQPIATIFWEINLRYANNSQYVRIDIVMWECFCYCRDRENLVIIPQKWVKRDGFGGLLAYFTFFCFSRHVSIS